MVSGGQKVISIRSKMSTARKGRILRATAPRLSPEMEPETIRHIAHGWGQHADGQIDHYNGPQVEGAKANVRAMVIAKNNRFISLSPQE